MKLPLISKAEFALLISEDLFLTYAFVTKRKTNAIAFTVSLFLLHAVYTFHFFLSTKVQQAV